MNKEHKDFYINQLPPVLALSAQSKIALDNALTRFSYYITVNRCIENSSSTDQLHNTVLLIFRY